MSPRPLPLLVLATLALGACDPPSLPVERWAHPRAPVSAEFASLWRDGRAEVAAYRGRVERYGAVHDAEAVLVTVTEPFDRRTLVKDDDAPPGERLEVLKLNLALRFQTGIYPYSVLTSVFSPVAAFEGERFSPAKITLGAQEWCGGVFSALWPDRAAFLERTHSYFASEGDREARTPVPADALYEDALYLQLRELDGPFAGGADWQGALVPSLWRARRSHTPLAPEHARIERRHLPDREVFTLRTDGGLERTFEIGHDEGHPILAFRGSDGDDFRLIGRQRLPYWELHDPGEESFRAELGLSSGLEILPASP